MKIAARILHIVKKPLSKFKTLSRKKKIVIIVVILISGVVFQSVLGGSKSNGHTLAKAERATIVETVSETGGIAANGRTDVYSPTIGVVTEVLVANGETVDEGQELFKVESSATEQEAKAAYASYLTAQSTLNAAKSNENALRSAMYGEWETYRNLATNDTYESGDGVPKNQEREATEFQMAQDDWIAAEAKYKDQQTVVTQAQAQVSSTLLLYQATQNATVKAPVSGTVANLSVTIGSPVTISTLTAQSRPVLAISNASTTEVVVALSESDIAKADTGQEVMIDVSAVDDKIYNGLVRRVDTIGTDDGGVTRYNVYIEITDGDARLRSGMSVDVEIVTSTISDALSVPNSAVKPYQGGRAVRVIDEKTKEVKYVPVTIGVRGSEKTQILSGIEEGQEVITALSNEELKRPGLFGM